MLYVAGNWPRSVTSQVVYHLQDVSPDSGLKKFSFFIAIVSFFDVLDMSTLTCALFDLFVYIFGLNLIYVWFLLCPVYFSSSTAVLKSACLTQLIKFHLQPTYTRSSYTAGMVCSQCKQNETQKIANLPTSETGMLCYRVLKYDVEIDHSCCPWNMHICMWDVN
ncbi:uncharacterized protein LOC131334000 isoform X2 [Rhododendron vialii]|uniref:uncharacterized protein LOC131334000 isoform X2 n=1 Tax=Rhododendron vialii TaxID=182163 RepID=UPI00265FE8A3|nr:uncharacterized protein LOC131334000 isoform X2 [Rhododendron vialii]